MQLSVSRPLHIWYCFIRSVCELATLGPLKIQSNFFADRSPLKTSTDVPRVIKRKNAPPPTPTPSTSAAKPDALRMHANSGANLQGEPKRSDDSGRKSPIPTVRIETHPLLSNTTNPSKCVQPILPTTKQESPLPPNRIYTPKSSPAKKPPTVNTAGKSPINNLANDPSTHTSLIKKPPTPEAVDKKSPTPANIDPPTAVKTHSRTPSLIGNANQIIENRPASPNLLTQTGASPSATPQRSIQSRSPSPSTLLPVKHVEQVTTIRRQPKTGWL